MENPRSVGIASGCCMAMFAIVMTALLILPRTAHTNTYILMAEYGLLLPALALGLPAKAVVRGAVRVPVPPFLLTLGGFLVLNLLIQHFIARGVISGDASAYHFQARVFADGMLAAEAPPDVTVDGHSLRSLFRFHHHVMIGDRWMSQYPPGWPALLSLGVRIGLDWLVNPVLALWILFLTWRVGSLLYSPRTGALAAAVITLSPSFQHQTSGFLSHSSCGAFIISAFYLFLLARQNSFWVRSALSLLCLAAAMAIRPYTAFCAGAVLGVLLLVEAHRRGRARRFLLLGTAACMVFLAAYLGYNLHLHGRLSSYSSGGWTAGEVFVTSPVELLQVIAMNTRWSLQGTMFYAFPFVLPLAAYALWRDEDRRRAGWLLAAMFLVPASGYSLIKFVSGHYYGERYYYELYFALCLLAARGLLLLWETEGRAALRMLSPAVTLCMLVYGVHVAVYARDATAAFDPHTAVLAVSKEVTEPRRVVFLPVNLGRDINENAPRWQDAPAIYLEDPGEPLRAAVARILGRRTWHVIAYDTASKKASVVRGAVP